MWATLVVSDNQPRGADREDRRPRGTNPMRDIFEAELAQLGDDLVNLSSRVHTAITKAGHALSTADLDVAQTVIAEDAETDELSQETDERAILLLAQQAPVATDLRVVVSALRMSQTLERMGDLAEHIAQIARRSYPEWAIPSEVQPVFLELQSASERLAARLIALLSTRDLEVAHQIEQDDDIIDALHQETFRAILSPEWKGTAQQVVDITLAARYYERFGDHGVSIARRVIYLVTGDDARV